MPREQINTSRHRFASPVREVKDGPVVATAFRYPNDGEGLRDDETWELTPALYIGWHGDGIGHPEGTPTDSHLDVFVEIYADELLRIADDIRAAEKRGKPYPKMHRVEIVSLTRPETQKLIRVLKRARNSVFGADE